MSVPLGAGGCISVGGFEALWVSTAAENPPVKTPSLSCWLEMAHVVIRGRAGQRESRTGSQISRNNWEEATKIKGKWV